MGAGEDERVDAEYEAEEGHEWGWRECYPETEEVIEDGEGECKDAYYAFHFSVV